tara:strand:+ start:17530 stop:18651 length:1122 start_codon:yes stop_codon:yes gene_type:complete
MSKKKKIDWLIVLPSDSLGGGAEQLLFNISEFVSNQGDKCKIIIASKKKSKGWEILEDKCNIKYMPFSQIHLGYIALIPYLIFNSLNFQVTQTLSSQTLINGLIGFLKRIGFFKKTKVIVRESNSIFHLLNGVKLKMYALAYNIGYSSVNLVICQTDYMKNELLKSVPWMRKRIKMIVINNPINSDLILRKSKLQLPEIENMDFMVAAGRLVPAKGFDILLDSFQSIHNEFPNLKLLILGEGKDKNKLEAIIDKNKLHQHVKLVGFVENVYPYFKKAKLCVMSSRIEGFPNVLLQMMSQNTKVVSTLSAGGIEKLDGVFTCKTEDTEGLAEAIKKCLNSNTEINRKTFDQELGKRSLKNFVNEITKQSSSQIN